jgi:hypothetical protein
MVTLLSVITIDTLRTGNDSKASKLDWARWLRLAGRIGGGELWTRCQSSSTSTRLTDDGQRHEAELFDRGLLGYAP